MSSNQILLKFALQYPWLIVLTLILSFSGALFNGIGTALIIPLLLAFLNNNNLEFSGGPPILKKSIALFNIFPEESRLIGIISLVLLAIILKNLASYFNIMVASHLSRKLVNTMRLDGMKLILGVDLDFHSKNQIGDIVNRVSQEITRTALAIKTAVLTVSTIITITFFVVCLIFLSWQLTIISVFLLSLIALANQNFVNQAKYYGTLLSQTSKSYSNKLFEILTGIRLIKTVGTEEKEYQLIKSYIQDREEAEFGSQANYTIIGPLNEVSGIISILIMVIIGRSLFAKEVESFSTILLTYMIFVIRLLPFISQLNNNRSQFANAAHGIEIVTDFLRRDNKPFMSQGEVSFKHLKEEIKLENVSFAYPDSKDLVLKNVNLSIYKGQTVALVGASGAGKSTLADLLPRFYDPTSGRITIDGINLTQYNLKSLRQALGVVSQDTFLFNNSVGYNIAYGLENVSEEEIIEAAKRANAYEFISQLPEKLETIIGDRGVLLSGGQRQRIAIARALLRNPDILILDEATSALDTVSERLVQQAIDELCRHRTTVVIAHRLSTIQKANQIVALDKGQVMEIGTHEELLAKGGYYASLYYMQFSARNGSLKNDSKHNGNCCPMTTIQEGEQMRTGLSYEVRSHLTSMLGSLRLVSDGFVENHEEQKELIEDSYSSAIHLLNTIQSYEHQDSSRKESSV